MQTDPLKILIIGARSKVAEAIIRLLLADTHWNLVLLSSGFSSQVDIERVTCYPFDYSRPQMLKEIMLRELPTFTINCAAMTNVDACEDDRSTAWSVNVKLVETIARMCKITDSHLIHFSTDYIFDGTKGLYYETDTPNPLSYYGKTKLASENVCRSSGVLSTIIRTNVVYGISSYQHTDFADWVIAQFNKNIPFKVVTDQISNATLTDDIALALLKIMQLQKQGIYHIAGVDWQSRLEFARCIAHVYGFNEDIIQPILTADLQQKAKRPLKGGLLTLKAESELGVRFSTSLEGLQSLRRQIAARDELQTLIPKLS
ncbi:MAG: SDR family oxidoreductase [Candidatus Kapaibacterium sp.]